MLAWPAYHSMAAISDGSSSFTLKSIPRLTLSSQIADLQSVPLGRIWRLFATEASLNRPADDNESGEPSELVRRARPARIRELGAVEEATDAEPPPFVELPEFAVEQ
jgi:hypothetical protein